MTLLWALALGAQLLAAVTAVLLSRRRPDDRLQRGVLSDLEHGPMLRGGGRLRLRCDLGCLRDLARHLDDVLVGVEDVELPDCHGKTVPRHCKECKRL